MLGVSVPVTVSATYRSKLLNTPTRDGFGDVDVAIRVDGRRVSECEMAAVMARARHDAAYSQSSEDRRGCLVNQPGVVVAKIDIDNDALTCRALRGQRIDIGPEVHVIATSTSELDRSGISRICKLERVVSIGPCWRRYTRRQADVDDAPG